MCSSFLARPGPAPRSLLLHRMLHLPSIRSCSILGLCSAARLPVNGRQLLCRSQQGADGLCPLPLPPGGHPFGLCWRPKTPCCRDAGFSFTLPYFGYFGHSLRAGKRHFTLQTGLQGITRCFQDWRVPGDWRVLCPLTAISHISASDSLPQVQTVLSTGSVDG